jgi:hypothetical protein
LCEICSEYLGRIIRIMNTDFSCSLPFFSLNPDVVASGVFFHRFSEFHFIYLFVCILCLSGT